MSLTELKEHCVKLRNFIETDTYRDMTPLDQGAYKALLHGYSQDVAIMEAGIFLGDRT